MREVQPTPGVLFGPSLTLSNKQAFIPGQITAPNKRIRTRARRQLSEKGDCVREESDGCVPVRLVLIQKGQSRAGAGRSTLSEKARQPTAPNASRPGEDGMAWDGMASNN
ncbi:hypothetical protein GE21DRAFT_1293558 [Neurospora crassa]|nr:hypothetical protein GE21DRAFT_1293558 [Neurospora crassa]